MATIMHLCRDGKKRPRRLRSATECESDFWRRVSVGGMNECWEWKGGRASKQNPLQFYGVVWFLGRKWKTHRASYSFVRGGIPRGMLVCHSCDNPPCCNPFHLFLGTHKDNALDCHRKGRAPREIGEDRYNAVLTEDLVREIRSYYRCRKNGGMDALAKKYGVSRSMIFSILKRQRWKHVD